MDSKIYAGISSAVYAVVLVVAFLLVEIKSRPAAMQQNDVIYIEYVEPEPPPKPEPEQKRRAKTVAPPVPTTKPNVKENPPHKTPDPEENTQQSEGKEEVTRTVNPRAQMPNLKNGVDKPADVGNPKAKQDSVTKSTGAGRGLSEIGTIDLDIDKGLAGRGCDVLPSPTYPPGNKGGIVVVRVVVDPTGKVSSAAYEQRGSTTQDPELKNAALKAARRARFSKTNDLTTISGTITYKFRLN
ncbi:MAG: TonB family protein [Alistipes sp.]|nr:TonB family protein [Alistipes sp.]